MIAWETTIRTGSADADHATLESWRRTYAPQGLTLYAQPLPGGGLHVRAVPGAAPQMQYQPAAYGGPAPVMMGVASAAALPGDEALGAARVRYLRKVYGLLFASAAIAILCGVAVTTLGPTETLRDGNTSLEVPLVVGYMLEVPGLLWGAFALLFVSTIVASAVSKVRGVNVVALFGVSGLMGLELAPMAWVAQVSAGFGETLSANPVRDAFSMVGALFVGLTTYVFITKRDFSFLRATLSMGFFVVFAGCILAFVLGSEIFSLAIASVGALLAIGFLLYQTSYIFRNSAMDDPVGDALGLIVQLRNLFMFLLRIFMSRR
jgi:modulator of FtsH protease